MPITIRTSYTIQVVGGPTLAGNFELSELEAYTHVSVLIPKEANDHKIDVLKNVGSDFRLLVISPTIKDSKISLKKEGSEFCKLEGPIIVSYSTAVNALGDITKLSFKNEGDTPEKIEILIAPVPANTV